MNNRLDSNKGGRRPQSARPHRRNASGTPISYDAPQAHSANEIAEEARRRAAHAVSSSTRDLRKHKGSGRKPAPGGRRPVGPRRRGRGTPAIPGVAVGVLAFFAIACALGWCYFTMWRSVTVTVNGEAVSMRVNSTVGTLLEDNEYFGAKPGRLLSVSDAVLDEKGGERCVVTLGKGDDAKKLDEDKFDSHKLEEGAVLKVGDGADKTEEYTEEATTVAPKLQVEQGGAIQYVRQWGKNGKKAVWTGKVSGETVDKGVVVEPQDMVIASRNVNPKGEKGKKYIALTFDDGPSQYTQDILDILKDKGAHATFYNLGENAASYPKLSRAIIDSGCELASHTQAHENLPTLGRKALRAEITDAFDAIEDASGMRPQMIRAPYGAFTAQEWLRSYDLISCNVLWNIDTLDWELPGAAAIEDIVVRQAYNGAIVLMHDGGGNREQDIAALPGMIDALQKDGYELVTVSELMALDDSFPEEVVKGEVKVPKDAVIPE